MILKKGNFRKKFHRIMHYSMTASGELIKSETIQRVSAEEISALVSEGLASHKITVVDVRTPEDFSRLSLIFHHFCVADTLNMFRKSY